jgi:hypothetical protein
LSIVSLTADCWGALERGWDSSHTKSLGHVATIGFAYFGHWMGFC